MPTLLLDLNAFAAVLFCSLTEDGTRSALLLNTTRDLTDTHRTFALRLFYGDAVVEQRRFSVSRLTYSYFSLSIRFASSQTVSNVFLTLVLKKCLSLSLLVIALRRGIRRGVVVTFLIQIQSRPSPATKSRPCIVVSRMLHFLLLPRLRYRTSRGLPEDPLFHLYLPTSSRMHARARSKAQRYRIRCVRLCTSTDEEAPLLLRRHSIQAIERQKRLIRSYYHELRSTFRDQVVKEYGRFAIRQRDYAPVQSIFYSLESGTEHVMALASASSTDSSPVLGRDCVSASFTRYICATTKDGESKILPNWPSGFDALENQICVRNGRKRQVCSRALAALSGATQSTHNVVRHAFRHMGMDGKNDYSNPRMRVQLDTYDGKRRTARPSKSAAGCVDDNGDADVDEAGRVMRRDTPPRVRLSASNGILLQEMVFYFTPSPLSSTRASASEKSDARPRRAGSSIIQHIKDISAHLSSMRRSRRVTPSGR